MYLKFILYAPVNICMGNQQKRNVRWWKGQRPHKERGKRKKGGNPCISKCLMCQKKGNFGKLCCRKPF